VVVLGAQVAAGPPGRQPTRLGSQRGWLGGHCLVLAALPGTFVPSDSLRIQARRQAETSPGGLEFGLEPWPGPGLGLIDVPPGLPALAVSLVAATLTR
jgi:hypothetical protein